MIENYDALTVGKFEEIERVQCEYGAEDTNGTIFALHALDLLELAHG